MVRVWWDEVIEILDEYELMNSNRNFLESEQKTKFKIDEINRMKIVTNFVLKDNGFITPIFDDGALVKTLLYVVSRLTNSILRYFFSS